MTETNYKLSVTSLEIKDPAPFSNTTMASTPTLASNKHVFELLSTTQTQKDLGLTKTIHHGQSKIKSSTINHIVPFFEITNTTVNTLINIGRVVLHINYVSVSDNSSKPQLLRVVGIPQSGTTITSSLVSATEKSNNVDLFGTNAGIYKSNFYLDGFNNTVANTTQKFIVDLNKTFKIDTASSYIALGLEFNVAPTADTEIYIDAYTEVITV